MKVALHPVVRAIANDVTFRDGRLALNEVRTVAHKEALSALDAVQKKAALVSLVAFAVRILREAREGGQEAAGRLLQIAAEI